MQDAGGLSDKSKVSLMLPFSSEDELTETYHKLLDGGMALMELSPQSFASLFAWVKDKFGIDWQLMYD
jgi:PhnB protein